MSGEDTNGFFRDHHRGAPRISGELARSRGLARAAVIWMRMLVAPGEKVYRKAI